MVGLYLIYIYILMDSARRIQFDENYVYLTLVGGLTVGLYVYIGTISGQKRGENSFRLTLNRIFLDIFRLQQMNETLLQSFIWLIQEMDFLKRVQLGGKLNDWQNRRGTVQYLGTKKNALNIINRFLHSAITINYRYR